MRLKLIIGIFILGVVIMPIKSYFISPDTEELEQKFIDEMINEISPKYGLEPALVKAIVKQESGFEIFARRYDYRPLSKQSWHSDYLAKNNLKGSEYYYSIGLMQVLYVVALDNGYKGSYYDLFNAKENINQGCIILFKLMKRYGGDVKKAISAYNAGSHTLGNEKTYTNPVYQYYKDFGGKL